VPSQGSLPTYGTALWSGGLRTRWAGTLDFIIVRALTPSRPVLPGRSCSAYPLTSQATVIEISESRKNKPPIRQVNDSGRRGGLPRPRPHPRRGSDVLTTTSLVPGPRPWPPGGGSGTEPIRVDSRPGRVTALGSGRGWVGDQRTADSPARAGVVSACSGPGGGKPLLRSPSLVLQLHLRIARGPKMADQEARTGAALEEALKEGTLGLASASITGMVDKSDKAGHIRFTIADCNGWLDLPVEMIETWVVEGHQRCQEHSHPRARLTLKEPTDPGQKLYFGVLSQLLVGTQSVGKQIGTRSIGERVEAEMATLRPRRGGGGTSPCLYYSCGTCSDGTVMLCSDIIGCPPDLCSDIVLPVFTRRFSRF
jgi:hypothetical protein